MKVLLTHERFLPDFGGGGEEIVYQTARHLRSRGVEVNVLTTGDPRQEAYQGIATRRLPISRYRLNLAARKIQEAAHDADLIQTFNYHACWPSLVAGRRAGRPVVCCMLGLFRDAWLGMRGPLVGRCHAAWERFLVRRPFARTVFLSEYSRRDGLGLGADPRTAVVIPPGIDPAPHGEKDGSVLFVGKFETRKGVHDVLEVARALPAVRFRMGGWGPEEDALRAAAPANVEFPGFLQGEALRNAYARASVFLFPSRAETFGLAVAEAMAAGCAVVSSVPLEYDGARVEPGDTARMARVVSSLLAQPRRLAEMGERNVERARAYSWDASIDRLLLVYREVLREARAC